MQRPSIKPFCIYCCVEKSVRDFNKEHVLPRAFGGYQDALTLAKGRRYRVCRACNSRLGDTLDLALGRSSFEAILRAQRGMIATTDILNIRYDRVTISLPAGHPRGPMLLRLVPNPDGTQVGVGPAPQLRISIDDSPLRCVPEWRIASDLPGLLHTGTLTRVEIFWWDGDAGAPRRIEEKARAAGLTQQAWKAIDEGRLPDIDQIDTSISIVFDSLIARAIAKIAYEYFFYVNEPQAPRIIQMQMLDDLRRFVWDGVGDWQRFVTPSNHPIAANETATARVTHGHILALDWPRNGRAGVVVHVTLFNDITYTVRVCDEPSLIWEEVNQGHHFNVRTRRVERMIATRIRPYWIGGPRSALNTWPRGAST